MATGRGGRDDHAAIRRLADELLPALMARLEASPLGELEVRQDGWRVRLRKPPRGAETVDGTRAPAARPAGTRATASGTAARPPADGRSGRAARPAEPRERSEARPAVTSPAVGTFHPAGGVTVGRTVRAGDVVAHVEVLGVPQEVIAPFDGTLGRLLVEAGQVVEYGEPLMRIEPTR